MNTYDHCVHQAGGFQKNILGPVLGDSGPGFLGFLKLWNCHLSRCVAALPPDSKPGSHGTRETSEAGNQNKNSKPRRSKALRLLGPLLIMSSLAMSQLNKSTKTTLQICSANHWTLFSSVFWGCQRSGSCFCTHISWRRCRKLRKKFPFFVRSSRPEIPRAARTSSAAASTCLNQRPFTMDLPEKNSADTLLVTETPKTPWKDEFLCSKGGQNKLA